ncbi:MAG: hypothetical protein HC794_07225 [Nitrospiraceae bacterium]|nr:hypothetical protein [Nitrospiraceae bacterium]
MQLAYRIVPAYQVEPVAQEYHVMETQSRVKKYHIPLFLLLLNIVMHISKCLVMEKL